MIKPPPALLLNRDTISELLTLDECIPVVQAAFLSHAEGRTLIPSLMHVDADGGEFHIKAGGLRLERTYFACKVNGGFFANKKNLSLPNILGLILLCDGGSGVPLAVLESGYLTRLRTGAATAVAAKYLARPESEVVTICGAGIQAEIQLRALTKVLPISRAILWGREAPAEVARRLTAELTLDVLPTTDLEWAARQSDVIVTCTPAKQWILGLEHVSPGTFIAAVGADSPDKQEIEPALMAANSVVCDLAEQCAHVGDLHHAVAAGLMTVSQLRGELGAIIAGTAPRRTSPEEIIIFDSTGTALQDAAAAAAVYERALAQHRGTRFGFWG